MNSALLISSDDAATIHVQAKSSRNGRISGRLVADTPAEEPELRQDPAGPAPAGAGKVSRGTVKALTRRGIARARTGDIPGAIADYTEALRLDSTHLPARANRGVARFHAHDYPAAVEDCTLALEAAPNLNKAWLVRGLARVRLGLFQEAQADLLQYVELVPHSGYHDLVRKTLDEIEDRLFS